MPSAQDRYNTPLDVIRLSNGRRVYRSAIPKSIMPDVSRDAFITATETTRMDVVAQNVYGSAENWWILATANGKVDGSLYFRPGSQIVIPQR